MSDFRQNVEKEVVLAIRLANRLLGSAASPANVENLSAHLMDLGTGVLESILQTVADNDPVTHQTCMYLTEEEQQQVRDRYHWSSTMDPEVAHRELLSIDREVGAFDWEETVWKTYYLQELTEGAFGTFDLFSNINVPYQPVVWVALIEKEARKVMDKVEEARHQTLAKVRHEAEQVAESEMDRQAAEATKSGWGDSPLNPHIEPDREEHIKQAGDAAYQAYLVEKGWDMHDDWEGSPLGIYPDLDSLVKHHPWGDILRLALWWAHQSSFLVWDMAQRVKKAAQESVEGSFFAVEILNNSPDTQDMQKAAREAHQENLAELKILWQRSRSESYSSTEMASSTATSQQNGSTKATPPQTRPVLRS